MRARGIAIVVVILTDISVVVGIVISDRLRVDGCYHGLPRTINPAILQHALWMQREGYKNSTIKSAIKTLKAVGNRCNITNPMELKTYLATATYTQNRKHKIITDANRLYRQLGIRWERPIRLPW